MATELTPDQRVRRAALLCGHCLRNLAFYRAAWRGKILRTNRQFWINATNNALDICVMDWCKLFADWNGQHHWRTMVSDRDAFMVGLLQKLQMTGEQYQNYRDNTIKLYRDKFVAHLDTHHVMHTPLTRVMRKSTSYLYEYLMTDPATSQFLTSFPATSHAPYSQLYRAAYDEFSKLDSRGDQ